MSWAMPGITYLSRGTEFPVTADREAGRDETDAGTGVEGRPPPGSAAHLEGAEIETIPDPTLGVKALPLVEVTTAEEAAGKASDDTFCVAPLFCGTRDLAAAVAVDDKVGHRVTTSAGLTGTTDFVKDKVLLLLGGKSDGKA